MAEGHRHFVPAAGVDWLLPLYDPVQRWLLREEARKRPLVEQADIRSGQRVLDLGCGTGTLTVRLKQLHPAARVEGLDPDPKALALARRKAEKAGVDLRLTQGFADALPWPDASFDRVFSSFMFHHLDGDTKRAMLREVRRVLRPGGSLHLLDFGPPHGRQNLLARWLHHGESMRDNVEGRIPALLRDADLADAAELDHAGTLFGSISYYRAAAPA